MPFSNSRLLFVVSRRAISLIFAIVVSFGSVATFSQDFAISASPRNSASTDDSDSEPSAAAPNDESAPSVVERLQIDKENIAELAKFLRDEKFPYRFLQASANVDPSEIEIADGQANATVRLDLSIDSDEFYVFLERMRPILEKISFGQKTATQNNPKIGKKIDCWRVPPQTEPQLNARYSFIAIPERKPIKFQKIRWNTFAVPKRTEIITNAYSNIELALEMKFLDKNQKTLFIDRRFIDYTIPKRLSGANLAGS